MEGYVEADSDDVGSYGLISDCRCSRIVRAVRAGCLPLSRKEFPNNPSPPMNLGIGPRSTPAYHHHFGANVCCINRLDLGAEPDHASAHIGYACRNPDAGFRRRSNHPSRHSRITRNAAASTVPAIRTCAFDSVSSIETRGTLLAALRDRK